MNSFSDKQAHGAQPDPSSQLSAQSLGLTPGRDRLRGLRILVIGAGQRHAPEAPDLIGNGRAISLLLAREGACLACADRELTSVQATVLRIKAEGGQAFALEADVAEPEQIASMVQAAHARLGGLDGVVFNVGISNAGALAAETPQSWDHVMQVNVRAAMLSAQMALPKMAPGGSIVFISSTASRSPGGRLPAYEVSKGALAALCRAVAMEGHAQGVRANVVCPGLVDTPLGRYASSLRPARAQRPVPFGRQATAWDVAHATLFLISGDAAYINAQELVVDGGLGANIVRAAGPAQLVVA
ncbi:MAG: SDR family oxidoreductase [Comamonadaceae bacterium]|nr:MAG: SDR family oxidoreductase [Comamonadaceae bacterium]